MIEIKPALTPEEWHDGGYNSPGLSVVLASSALTVGFRLHVAVKEHPLGGALGDHGDLHALAALCLYEQPFGFTRDMVEAVRSMVYYLRSGSGFCPVCEEATGWKMVSPPICSQCGFVPLPNGAYMPLVLEAAANIAALLPPEAP